MHSPLQRMCNQPGSEGRGKIEAAPQRGAPLQLAGAATLCQTSSTTADFQTLNAGMRAC